MIEIEKMYHKDGKIIFKEKDKDWYQLECVTSDLVVDTYGDVIATKIPTPITNEESK